MTNPQDQIYAHNKAGYSAKGVGTYKGLSELQAPESKIAELLASALPDMAMLDVGVGAGRTAVFFAPRVRNYVGVDYVPAFVEECRSRFQGTPFQDSFRVGDAQAMPEFADGSFDFILFSFNGIDCVSLTQRHTVLGEMRRLCRKGGYFCFSSHNMNSLAGQFTPSLSLQPLVMAKRWYRALRLRVWNRSYAALKRKGLAVVREPGNQMHVYVCPDVMVRSLEEAGFENVRIFELQGREIDSQTACAQNTDGWLYYLCSAR